MKAHSHRTIPTSTPAPTPDSDRIHLHAEINSVAQWNSSHLGSVVSVRLSLSKYEPRPTRKIHSRVVGVITVTGNSQQNTEQGGVYERYRRYSSLFKLQLNSVTKNSREMRWKMI